MNKYTGEKSLKKLMKILYLKFNSIEITIQLITDTLFQKCEELGVIPDSRHISSIIKAISDIANNKYNDGVRDTKKGTATSKDVLSGKTFTNGEGVGISGTMPNRGDTGFFLTPENQTYRIPDGYYSGRGSIEMSNVYQLPTLNITENKMYTLKAVDCFYTGELKIDVSQLYTKAYNAGRTQGQADVKNSPNTYSLYTRAQYDTNYNNGRTQGRNDVKNAPNSYSLYTKSQYDSNYNSGRTQGQNDIKNNPNGYSLYTAAQYNSRYTEGYNAAAAKFKSFRANVHVICTVDRTADNKLMVNARPQFSVTGNSGNGYVNSTPTYLRYEDILPAVGGRITNAYDDSNGGPFSFSFDYSQKEY